MPIDDEQRTRMDGGSGDAGDTPRVRVLVVADDPLVASGLVLLLASEIEVVGQLTPRDDLNRAIRAGRAAVVLWDLGPDPRAAIGKLADLAQIAVPVVVLVPGDASVTEAISAGASGVLLRGIEATTLRAALAAASRSLIVLDPAIASVLRSRERRLAQPAEELTAREIEVLQQLAAGLPNKVIAARLGISDHTVKFHVNAILSKLGAESRTEAVVRAARLGLVIL